MTRPLHSARCLCGLRLALHFTGPHCSGRKLDCATAATKHGYATKRNEGLKAALARSAS